MENTRRRSARAGGVFDRLLRHKLASSHVTAGSLCGARARLMRPSSSVEVQAKAPSFQAGTGIRLAETQRSTGQPIRTVTRANTHEACLGRPMKQIVADTCVLVSCIVCVDAVHRFQYEKVHQGQRTLFPYTLMPDAAFWELFTKCRGDGTWVQGVGANVGRVLTKIQEMGGVPATTTSADASAPPAAQRTTVLLPLSSWQEHMWDDGAGGLSSEHVAALLDSRGPCVGVLWVVLPKYAGVVASGDGNHLVYRECIGRRDARARQESKDTYGDHRAGWHAVVCFAYRFYGEEMHVLVLDNHDVTGPRRWIHVDELARLYTLSVVV